MCSIMGCRALHDALKPWFGVPKSPLCRGSVAVADSLYQFLWATDCNCRAGRSLPRSFTQRWPIHDGPQENVFLNFEKNILKLSSKRVDSELKKMFMGDYQLLQFPTVAVAEL